MPAKMFRVLPMLMNVFLTLASAAACALARVTESEWHGFSEMQHRHFLEEFWQWPGIDYRAKRLSLQLSGPGRVARTFTVVVRAVKPQLKWPCRASECLHH